MKKRYRYDIKLNSNKQFLEFVKILNSVSADVKVGGRDKSGNSWEFSVKSILGVLRVASELRCGYAKGSSVVHQPVNLGLGITYCECDEDIAHKIQKYIKK